MGEGRDIGFHYTGSIVITVTFDARHRASVREDYRYENRSVGVVDHNDCEPNQSMKPTAPFRIKSSLHATTPCRGLSLSR